MSSDPIRRDEAWQKMRLDIGSTRKGPEATLTCGCVISIGLVISQDETRFGGEFSLELCARHRQMSDDLVYGHDGTAMRRGAAQARGLLGPATVPKGN